VIGTLSSPILVQYMNSRSKAQEYELQREQRSEERQAEMDERKHEALRVEYTNLNAKVRDLVKALSDYLHLIGSRKITPEARAPLGGLAKRISRVLCTSSDEIARFRSGGGYGSKSAPFASLRDCAPARWIHDFHAIHRGSNFVWT
jgi:hypothetical protein